MIPESPGAVRALLAARGIRPRRHWGQSFLVDSNIRDLVAAESRLGKDDVVLEVGAGLGMLTKGLLARGARVVASEMDRRLVDFLEEAFVGEERLVLVPGNVLERGRISPAVSEALDTCRGPEPYSVVSNLPYSCATPLLASLARRDPPPERVVVMVQREVAFRMAGRPGSADYGPLAVLLGLRGEVRVLREIGGRVFFPPVSVRSALVSFVPRPVEREQLLAGERVAREAFRYRRKTLRRALKASGWEVAAVEEALSVLGIDPGCRPQALSPEEFAALGIQLAATI